jgi:pimeloyl-ACP methyl ester carboxylesterase
MTLAVTKHAGYFNSFDGTRIYYEVRGEGKPLVFVYGIACLINHWHQQINYFSGSYQTIILDYRGHHFSDIPEDKKNLRLESLAEDVICLCDHLKLDKAFFLGHSFGCEVLLEAYLKKPELFSGLCFVSGFFSNPFEKLLSQEQLKEIFVYIRMAYNSAPSFLNTVWRLGVTNPASVFLSSLVGGFNLEKTALKDIEIYAQGVANIDLRVFVTLFEQLTQFDGRARISQVQAPTLVIAGDKDALTPTTTQRALYAELPNSELLIIPNGSHCVQLDFPEEVNEKIHNFLKSKNY